MQISTMYDGSSYTGILSVNESLEEGASQSVQKVREGFMEEARLMQRL